MTGPRHQKGSQNQGSGPTFGNGKEALEKEVTSKAGEKSGDKVVDLREEKRVKEDGY